MHSTEMPPTTAAAIPPISTPVFSWAANVLDMKVAAQESAMAAAMLATRAEGETTIVGGDAVAKSYPTFFEDFRNAGGIAHEFDVG